jgi:hypothetical protein
MRYLFSQSPNSLSSFDLWGHLKVQKTLNRVRKENWMKIFGHAKTFSIALEFYQRQISSDALVSSGLQCCVNQP